MSCKMEWRSVHVDLFLVIFLLSASEIQAQQFVGDACRTQNAGGVLVSGKCAVIDKCPSVYRDLLAGMQPDTLCGFSGFDPIVCCPIEGSRLPSQVSATTPSTTTEFFDSSSGQTTTKRSFDIRISERSVGDVAKQKCDEYASSLFVLVEPPILTASRTLINTSLCDMKSKTLIVGGERADPKEFPHMAAVGYNPKSGGQTILWRCGGTLVSDRFVMTAAHCTFSREIGIAAWVQVGDLNLKRDDDDAAPQRHRVAERIRHPDYRRPTEYHDIALLRLSTRVTFDAYVRPACLPISRTIPYNQVIATGWGNIDAGEENESRDLLKVILRTVPVDSCNGSVLGSGAEYKLNRGVIDDWQICAGQPGKDTCQGDSGGPITVLNSNHECMYDVVGITSLGSTCGSVVPGVYTRVHNYLAWLENIIWR